MNKLKFNSKVCTTREQSEKLLSLGLKPETADMLHYKSASMKIWGVLVTPYSKEVSGLEKYYFPAWSLHRLIEMCNNSLFAISLYNNEVSVDEDLFDVYNNAFDNLVSVIGWLIKIGHFNKEYLK